MAVRYAGWLVVGMAWSIGASAGDLPSPVQSPPLLRCDPAVDINAIGGDSARHAWNVGYSDCEFELSPGKLTVDVCYNVDFVFNPYTTRYAVPSRCRAAKRLEFTASAGRIYRAKIDLQDLNGGGDGWRAWIADVTDTEAGVPDHSPVVNRSRRNVSKGERDSILLMRIDPPSAMVLKENGSASRIWFSGGALGGLYFRTSDPKGWAVRKAKIGDTFAISSAMLDNPGSLFVRKTVGPCNDYRVPVFEDVPGGRALYLGTFRFEPTDLGYRLKFSQDELDAARKFVAAEHPELADKVEVASYRMLRYMSFCFATSPNTLINDVGIVPPTVPVSRDVSAADSTP